MSQIFTPSTGETREGGDLRLNVLRVKAGDTVVAKAGFAGWIVGEVQGTTETHVALMQDGQPVNVTWRELAGIVRPGAKADLLVARFCAVELKAEEAAKVLRLRKYEALRGIMDGPSFARSNAFVPGM